jgi:hypothetical protein
VCVVTFSRDQFFFSEALLLMCETTKRRFNHEKTYMVELSFEYELCSQCQNHYYVSRM